MDDAAVVSQDSALSCVACDEQQLSSQGGALVCPSCGAHYPIESDIPDLRPERYRRGERTPAERRLERIFDDLQAWRAARDADHDEKARARARSATRISRLLERAEVRGAVLDVGGHDGWVRTLFRSDDVQMSVIDPMPRAPSAPVVVVRGLAEHLPFRAATFDWVLMLSCFDYFADPVRAVDEAHRVLVPGGRMLVIDPVYPEPVARFLDAHGGLGRAWAARRPAVWRLLKPRVVLDEIRAGARGGPRLHLHYYTLAQHKQLIERRFACRWEEREDGLAISTWQRP